MFLNRYIIVCKYLELSLKTMFNLNLRKLPSQYGEVSVMYSLVYKKNIEVYNSDSVNHKRGCESKT